jgi:NDP-sugar pyrophosphorylase family protein
MTPGLKAMVLAAGLGTRLRPLTSDRPKALVEVGGRPMLAIVLARLRAAGVTEAIVNVHHFADQIVDYLQANNFEMRIEISREEAVLETGGGLKQAAWFFLDGRSDAPFLVHNVDVISTVDLAAMLQFHSANRALATLAVQSRESSRGLLFDREGRLSGRRNNQVDEIVRPSGQLQARAFTGIHALSTGIFDCLTEEGAFPIISAYLRLAPREKILAFEAGGAYWRDLGRPESLRLAEADSARWA